MELCWFGIWGTVNNANFGTQDAIVVCRQLNYYPNCMCVMNLPFMQLFHSLTHALSQSLSLTCSLTHSLTHSPIHHLSPAITHLHTHLVVYTVFTGAAISPIGLPESTSFLSHWHSPGDVGVRCIVGKQIHFDHVIVNLLALLQNLHYRASYRFLVFSQLEVIRLVGGNLLLLLYI